MNARSPLAAGLLGVALLGVAPGPVQAATQCNTDPNAVPFEATVDPTVLNRLLSRLGDRNVRSPNVEVTLPGLCVDHRLPISTGAVGIPLGDAPFTVTPGPGTIQVELELEGPFTVGVDGGRYQAVNCDSSCVVELPYVGPVFNACDIEAGLVRPILSVFQASATWDDIHVSQVADTCVLGDCTAVHPIESTQASLFGFDVDATGFGQCQVCIDFPDPIPDPPCLNPCEGFDPLIEDLLLANLEEKLADAFVTRTGDGLLIKVFSRQIVKDFGCIDIPEVRECKGQTPPTGGLVRAPRDHGLNAIFYSLPLALAGVLALRLRRRAGAGVPAE
jgi:hypothetical protein